eukprot:TRINITY_DN647_c0_g1_i2.p1 TRINITY_DN647_c0_g1~~TRINITY_DN647_c0_g1_i2.p1  ORF type:complete len:471 (+),score=145.04 TRINITY_DN647_c0_g1_i2:122-1534(+)
MGNCCASKERVLVANNHVKLEEEQSNQPKKANAKKNEDVIAKKEKSKNKKQPSNKNMEGERIIDNYYEFGDPLGVGGFGEVVVGISRSDNKKFAVKKVSKLKNYRKMASVMDNEAKCMRKLSGFSQVVSLVDTFEDMWNYYIVMDLCAGGELMDRIYEKRHFSEKIAAQLFKQILQAVAHCHNNNVIHRDLKPENFLFECKEENSALKLTDFGLAVEMKSEDQHFKEICGSAYYIAPEVLKGCYNHQCDVWSAGIILYLLLSGTVPFGASCANDKEIIREVRHKEVQVTGKRWSHVSASARELVLGMLERDPSKRYTIKEAMEHQWLTDGVASDAAIDRSIVVSMCQFNARNKFKKEAMRLIASTLSAADVQKLRSAFIKVDQNNNQLISMPEMAQALQEAGINHEENMEKLMKEMDLDGDGMVNYEEWLTACVEQQLINHQNNIWWAFCQYDKDQVRKEKILSIHHHSL